MTNDDFNGWANRETWALALHLSNDEGIYNLVSQLARDTWEAAARDPYVLDATLTRQALARHRLAGVLKDLIEEWATDVQDASTGPGRVHQTIASLVLEVGSWWRADFPAIAESYIDELAPDYVETS